MRHDYRLMDLQNTHLRCSTIRMTYFPVLLLALIVVRNTFAYSVTLHDVTDTLKPEYEKYTDALKEAEVAFIQAEKLFNDPSFESRTGWKKEGHHSDIAIHSKSTPAGKVNVVSTVLDCNVDEVMRETWGGIEGLSSWSPTIAFAHVLVPLTDTADILYYGNNDFMVVTGREFLTSRLYRQTPEGYIMASRSVDLPEVPEGKDKVRAKVSLAATRFRPDPAHPKTKTLCDVVMTADLRGNLPKQLVDSTLPTMMAMVAEQNIKHFRELGKLT